MAVAPDAGEIELALDRAARALTKETNVAADRIAAAASLVGEWRTVLRHALDEGDAELAVVAAREWGHWRAVFASLTGERLPP